ncbi:MAG: DedA family protein [Chlamydiia bacterium]|nr:DedA family protein [Chlamydiia bacterium]
MQEVCCFITENAHFAHYVVFGFLILAGFNLPISEDLLIICSGVLAGTVIPENTWKLFTALFLGAYLSDIMVYGFGYRFGHNLWKIKWVAQMISKEKIESVRSYYRQFGVLTLIIGRFIPFGVRNCLFLTAGMAKMYPWKFIVADGIACSISVTTLFTLSYFCGMNSSNLGQHVKFVKILIFSVFGIALLAFIWYKRAKIRRARGDSENID